MIIRNKLSRQNIESAIKLIIEHIDGEKGSLDNLKLIKLCGVYTQTFTSAIDPHFFHEIAESALNQLIKKKYAQRLLSSIQPEKDYQEILKPLAEKLPTQTWRSQKQNDWQQFSTPPGIAYLSAYLLNPKSHEKILEPSAGTGSLAVWSSAIAAETYTNEIDERRRLLLEISDFAPTSYNAEFIDDFLPPEVSPNCVLMNPPFSANGGRTKNNSSKFGFRHVESALERLRNGGRFGIILGEAGGLDTKPGNDFWSKHSDRIEVRAVIKINGREYVKNGTTVDINLIIGKKLLVPQRTDWNQMLNKIICFSANTVEEAFTKAETFNLSQNQ